MSQASAAELLMLDLINQERTSRGIDPLAINSDLNESSEDHSQWMLDTDTFSHTGVNGSSSTQRIVAAGYDLEGNWATGENIALQSERGAPGIADDVRNLHASLMASPGHRANILNPNYDEIGIGIEVGLYGSYEVVMITQNFGATDAASSTPQPVTPDPIVPPEDGYLIGDSLPNNIRAEGGDDTVLAYGADDTIRGGSGNDLIYGGDGRDLIYGGAGKDDLRGNTGGDVMHGDAGSDRLSGGRGNDLVEGDRGGDVLHGDLGNDTLRGGAGKDTLFGDQGDDRLSGGDGVDSFRFRLGTENMDFGNDTILDFDVGTDNLAFDEDIWGGGLTPTEVVDTFASYDAQAGGVVFDFGVDETVTLLGVTSTVGLADDVMLI